jgi:hypothetical protein
MKKTLAIIFAVLLLGACTSSDLDKAKQAVKVNLKDPDSAQFKDVTVVTDIVCGQFNAKNSMGGYSDYEQFAYLDGALEINPHKIFVLCAPDKDGKFTKADRIVLANDYAEAKKKEQAQREAADAINAGLKAQRAMLEGMIQNRPRY